MIWIQGAMFFFLTGVWFFVTNFVTPKEADNGNASSFRTLVQFSFIVSASQFIGSFPISLEFINEKERLAFSVLSMILWVIPYFLITLIWEGLRAIFLYKRDNEITLGISIVMTLFYYWFTCYATGMV